MGRTVRRDVRRQEKLKPVVALALRLGRRPLVEGQKDLVAVARVPLRQRERREPTEALDCNVGDSKVLVLVLERPAVPPEYYSLEKLSEKLSGDDEDGFDLTKQPHSSIGWARRVFMIFRYTFSLYLLVLSWVFSWLAVLVLVLHWASPAAPAALQ